MNCPRCNTLLAPEATACPQCGTPVQQAPRQTAIPPQGYPQQPGFPPQGYPQQPGFPPQGYPQQPMFSEPRKKTVYILLGLLLGGFGIHDFYAGYTKKGVGHLVIAVSVIILLLIYIVGMLVADSHTSGYYGYRNQPSDAYIAFHLCVLCIAPLLAVINTVWAIVEVIATKKDARNTPFV